jgi:hypothetical protein
MLCRPPAATNIDVSSLISSPFPPLLMPLDRPGVQEQGRAPPARCDLAELKPLPGVFKTDDLRRRREEQQVELRRAKREESVAKRRNLDDTVAGADSDDDSPSQQLDANVRASARSSLAPPYHSSR